MQFIPPELAAMMAGMSSEEAFAEWQSQNQGYAAATGAHGMPSKYFYLVLAFPSDNYADKIDFHPALPMLVPVSGTQTKILGIYGDKAKADQAMEDDRESVHLVYKLKLQGSDATYKFLEYMATHNMMEKAE